jgi:peptidoglycan-associated lipoprotein
MIRPIRVLPLVLLALAVGACAKKTKPEAPVEDTTPPPVTTEPAPTDGRYTATDLDRVPCLRERVVYFDFDRADIRGEAQEILGCHGKYLRDNPGAAVTLEGHADERGTREYNLGLGERRGNAVTGALQANGGSAGQLTVVSYGEERPTCSESDEGCWSRNRRVEIVYTAK